MKLGPSPISAERAFSPLPMRAHPYTGWSKDRESAGFVAGWIAASLVIGRLPTAGLWGKFADTYGRRPAMMLTELAIIVGNFFFAFSTNLPMAIIVRGFFLGACNGWVTLMGLLCSEVAGSRYQTHVTGYVFSAGGVVQLIGPALGGVLTCFACPLQPPPSLYLLWPPRASFDPEPACLCHSCTPQASPTGQSQTSQGLWPASSAWSWASVHSS